MGGKKKETVGDKRTLLEEGDNELTESDWIDSTTMTVWIITH